MGRFVKFCSGKVRVIYDVGVAKEFSIAFVVL